jgi:carboxyl-terminal processing protease
MSRWFGRHWIWVMTLGTAAVYAPLAGSAHDERTRQKNLDALAEVITVIQKNAVDPPTPKQTSQATIQGMLHTLDPHSNFFSEEDYRRMREDQHGSFFGVGASISQRPDGVVIMSLVQGGPADKSGLQPGDYIKELDGKSAEGWNNGQVVQRLRGEKGTVVDVGIQRVGVEKLMHFKLTRAEVPAPSVSYAFMQTPTVGLVSVKDFGETTAQEFQKSVEALKQRGMKSLILDLRYNTGGIMDAAINICRQVLGPDELIVSQRGRDGRDAQEFRTPKDQTLDSYPIVVLINRSSASASEIVAGAIQDHDRGLLLGTTSWGKGLVQSAITIGRSRGLLLTTARYYTPSGRSIQRDYQHGLDDYLLVDDSEVKEDPKSPTFKTDLGRTVHGGGGITPDVRVDGERLSTFVSRVFRVGLFFRFALHEKGRDGIQPGKTITDVQLERFKTLLVEQHIPFTEEEWKDPKNQRDIRDQIAFELQTLLHGPEAGFRYLCDRDIQVKKALELLPEAEKLVLQKLAASRAKTGIVAIP